MKYRLLSERDKGLKYCQWYVFCKIKEYTTHRVKCEYMYRPRRSVAAPGGVRPCQAPCPCEIELKPY